MRDPQFGGVRIIENCMLTDGPFEDWSQVRSPGRARRRRAKHKQNIRLYYAPSKDAFCLPDGSIVMHPEMANQLRQAIEDQNSDG